MSELLRCTACGGAIVWDAARTGAACLFCGTVALELQISEDPIRPPDGQLPATIDAAEADRRFRAWAGRSWLRPAALRSAAIELQPLAIPAWRFECDLETHWAGLERARTRSGKQPVCGIEHARMQQMVPASGGLSQAELSALQPFDTTGVQPWREDGEQAWEPPAVSERRATIQAHALVAAAHRYRIGQDRGLVRCLVSPLVTDLDTRLLMLPIHIGTFRYRDRPWRVVINGQTGAVVGDAPVDRLKLLAVVLAAILALIVLAALLHGRG